MKFVVSSSILLSHLQAIGRVINSKNTLPILDCFLLNLKENTLVLVAADSETRMETSVEVNDAEGAGSLAISAKNLLDPLRELPEQPLTFDVNDETLEVHIYYHNGKYNFIGIKGDEFPEPKALNPETTMSISMEVPVLFNGINRTLFAAADDELRPVMNGIYFDISAEDVTFVASDGHKLIRITNKNIQSDGRSSFILPKKPANMLKSILPRETGNVEIKFDENNATFTLSGYKMICRFIEGRYPNYNSVIPKNNPNKANIDRVSLLNALKRVAVFSSQGTGLVKLQLSENNIKVSTQDIDFLTAAEETVPCQYTENVMSIGFKALFLIDILNNIPSVEVSLELSDPSRAGIILPVAHDDNEEILTLLMPMMLSDE